MNPFLVHIQINDQYQAFIGNGDVKGMATIVFQGMLNRPVLPCTNTEVAGDVQLIAGGFSPKTMVEIVELKADLLAGYVPKKGHKCTFYVNQKSAPLKMQVWSMNTQAGGELVRLNLVDENYSA